MADITVQITGMNKLINFAEQYPAISEKYINTAITRGLTRILGAVKTEAPFGVSGLLRDNWKITTGRFEGTLSSLSAYAAAVENGTEPHMPPVDAITPWANKYGLNPWAVAMSIKKNGTKANPFLLRAVNDVEDGINQDFEAALNSIVSEVNNMSDA